MKKLSILLFCILFLTACLRIPQADFLFTPTFPEVNEPVAFFNNSKDFQRLDWNFGNNTSSMEEDPIITFTAQGTYVVELVARNGLRASSKTATITVLP